MKTDDIALLITVLGLHNSPVRGRTRIQKELCILKHKNKIPMGFEFKSYYYGPYSDELANAVDALFATGLVEQSTVRLGIGVCRHDYTLTHEARDMFNNIVKELEKHQPKLLADLQRSIGKLENTNLPEIVSLAKKCSGTTSLVE